MKKILLLLTTLFLLNACSLDEDPKQDFFVEFLPMEIVHTPEYVSLGKPCEIKIKYQKPNGCYLFERFHIEKDGDAYLVAVQTVVRPNAECLKVTDITPEERSFTFKPSDTYSSGSYILKFYKGLDVNGNRTYTQVNIPVQ